MRRGNGATLLSLADYYADRGPDGHYTTNAIEAFYAVSCLDRPESRSLAAQRAQPPPSRTQVHRSSASFIAWGNLPCLGWPVPRPGRAARRSPRRAPRPILVVGTTRDPATPYEWARRVAGTLEPGRLLTYVGDGHTAYRRGSDCIDRAVDAYLLDGELPADGHPLPLSRSRSMP